MVELQAGDKKRTDKIHMAERADEIKSQIVQIEAVKEQAKIEADKEPALKELELKAQQDQASTRLAATPPPRNKDAKFPKLLSFIDEKANQTATCYALNVTLKMPVGRKARGLLS